MSFGSIAGVAYKRLPVNAAYTHSLEGFKEKIPFTRLVFTWCADPALVFQRRILSQPQSPFKVPRSYIHIALAHIKAIPGDEPLKIKCSFNSLITNNLLHRDTVT